MLTGSTSSIKNKRMLFAVLSLSLWCAAIAVGLANKKLFQRQPVPKPTAALTASPESNPAVRASREPLPVPAVSPQFDVSRNVIAGGGGTSTGGSFKLEGTIGQPAVGTTTSNGQFSQTGGYWQPQSGATSTPTPTPTPAPVVFLEEGTTNTALALDSVTFVQGPFTVVGLHNFSADQHTRVILFTSNPGLTQPDPSALTVTAGGASLLVEKVGPVQGVFGLNASYIVVRLPDGLATGPLPLVVILGGVASSNSPILGISP